MIMDPKVALTAPKGPSEFPGCYWVERPYLLISLILIIKASDSPIKPPKVKILNVPKLSTICTVMSCLLN